MIDWNRLAYYIYEEATAHTYTVAAYVARKIEQWNLSSSRITLVGHSMGAQMAGEIGRILKTRNRVIARIYGESCGPHFLRSRLLSTSRECRLT